MDCSETRLDRIESQRSPNVYYDRTRRSFIPLYLIFYGLRTLKGFLIKSREEGTPSTGEIELVPEFLTNLSFSDLFHLPGESVQMNPEIFSAVSAGNKECMEKLRSYGKQMACLKSDQGDSILHLVAARGHIEVVKSILFDCPCLLLVENSKSQLPLHVAAHAGHLAVVEAIVATVTFVSAKLSEEVRERLNIYVAKDKDGDTPLHRALKAGHKAIASCLVKANQRASFLANKDGVSPLYMVVESGYNIQFVKEMLKTTSSDGFEGRYSTLGSKLEGRKFLLHAALKAGRIGLFCFLPIGSSSKFVHVFV